jgi:hypothetical protein
MHGLTVRWSLEGCSADTMPALRDYVRDTSYSRFSGMDGLRFKTWRAREGEWFEGCYVFASPADRDGFEQRFRDGAPTSPVSEIVGSAPVLIEPCEVVAVAEGAAGFAALPQYDRTA